MLRPYAPHVEEWLEKLAFEPEVQDQRADNYVTRSEVSQRLKLSMPSIDRLLASGDLPHIKIRRSVRVSESALREYIESKTASGRISGRRSPDGESRTADSLPGNEKVGRVR